MILQSLFLLALLGDAPLVDTVNACAKTLPPEVSSVEVLPNMNVVRVLLPEAFAKQKIKAFAECVLPKATMSRHQSFWIDPKSRHVFVRRMHSEKGGNAKQHARAREFDRCVEGAGHSRALLVKVGGGDLVWSFKPSLPPMSESCLVKAMQKFGKPSDGVLRFREVGLVVSAKSVNAPVKTRVNDGRKR